MATIIFIVSILSSIIGAISGIGGGVIIRPMLDAISGYSVSAISFLSGTTVLAMTTTSLIKNMKSEVKFDKQKATYLAIGSVVGGLLGKEIFRLITLVFKNNQIGAIQSLVLFICSILVMVYLTKSDKIRTHNVNKKWVCLLIGLVLGLISSFLGIGGGPINITALMFLFSMDHKCAAINSIYIIFFSQLTSFLLNFINGFPVFDYRIMMLMIVGGVSGGFIGSYLSRKMTSKNIGTLFNFVLIIIAVICIYNFIRYIV